MVVAVETPLAMTILIGVVSSLVASLVFLTLMLTIRPKLELAKELARGTDGMCRIKLVNKSRRAAADVRVQMFLSTSAKATDGKTLVTLVPVHLKIDNDLIVVLPGYRKRDSESRYARRILVDDPAIADWQDDKHTCVVVRVFARDSVSNFGRQVDQEYMLSAIKEGEFNSGRDTTVKLRTANGDRTAPASA